MKSTHRTRRLTLVGLVGVIGLVVLLAACGQTTNTSTNGANSSINTVKTPNGTSAAATASANAVPTQVPPPYSFAKQWLPTTDTQDMPQAPNAIGDISFSPSSPQTGYFCGVTTASPDNSSATTPAISVTHDGGQSWTVVPDATAHYKSSCRLFIDQNNPQDLFAEAGSPQTQTDFFRSQDGGATWKTIAFPTNPNGVSLYVVGITVVNTRLVLMVGQNGEGSVPNPLFTSDNGGASWQPLSVSISGQTYDIGQQMWFDGSTIVIQVGTGMCNQGCGYLAPTLHTVSGRQPLSSQPPPTLYYLTSADGFRTWSILHTPVPNLNNLNFVRSGDGASVYAVGIATNVPNHDAGVSVAFYSQNGGASWRELPTFDGVENGYPSVTTLGTSGIWVLPDGSVLASSYHLVGTSYDSDAGDFRLQPGDASPSWQPWIFPMTSSMTGLVYPIIGQTCAGIRMWGLVGNHPDVPGGSLVYFDLP